MTAASTITTVPAGNLAATNVQSALDELDTEKVAVASTNATGTAVVFAARVTGDSFDRTQILANGSILLGDGTAAPNTKIWMDPVAGFAVQKVTGSGGSSLDLYAASDTTFPLFNVRRSKGTVTSPTALTSFSTLGAFEFYGYSGSTFNAAAVLTAFATETWDATHRGTAFGWANTITGGTSYGSRVYIYDRVLSVGTLPSTAPNSNERFRVNTVTTLDSAATAHIAPTATSAKGLVVQGLASQTANLFEAQSSAGAVLASVSATGAVTAPVATITNLREGLQAHGTTGTTETLDLANGTVHSATLDSNCTFTFTGSVASLACSFTLVLKQDATGNRTATWPAAVKWPGGTPPILTTTANATDVLVFTTIDNGTTWLGNIAGQAYA